MKKLSLTELRKKWRESGRKGGAQRAANLTSEQRKEIARNAAKARYAAKPLPSSADSA